MNAHQILLFEKSEKCIGYMCYFSKIQISALQTKQNKTKQKNTTLSLLSYKDEHFLYVLWKYCFIKPGPQATFNFFTFKCA